MPKIITHMVMAVCVCKKCHNFSFTFHCHYNVDKSAAWKRLNGLLTGLLTSRRWGISRVALKSIWEIDLESASALILVFSFSFVFFQLSIPFSNFKQEKETMVIVYSKQIILQLGKMQPPYAHLLQTEKWGIGCVVFNKINSLLAHYCCWIKAIQFPYSHLILEALSPI